MRTGEQKTWRVTVTAVAAASNAPEMIVSTSSVDHEGDRLMPSGCDLGAFERTAALLWAHDYYSIPIGTVTAVNVEPNGIRARWRWLENDQFADRVRNAWDQGVVRAASVGFRVLEATPNNAGGYDILRWMLLEVSLCPVPANPEAVRTLKNLGLWGDSGDRELTTTADAPSGNATIAGSDTEIAQAMKEIRAQFVADMHAHVRGLNIERFVQRGIDRVRGRIVDEELTIELADFPPGRGHRSSERTLEIEASPEQVNRMLAEVARETMANLDGRIERAVTATINRLRGRID